MYNKCYIYCSYFFLFIWETLVPSCLVSNNISLIQLFVARTYWISQMAPVYLRPTRFSQAENMNIHIDTCMYKWENMNIHIYTCMYKWENMNILVDICMYKWERRWAKDPAPFKDPVPCLLETDLLLLLRHDFLSAWKSVKMAGSVANL